MSKDETLLRSIEITRCVGLLALLSLAAVAVIRPTGAEVRNQAARLARPSRNFDPAHDDVLLWQTSGDPFEGAANPASAGPLEAGVTNAGQALEGSLPPSLWPAAKLTRRRAEVGGALSAEPSARTPPPVGAASQSSVASQVRLDASALAPTQYLENCKSVDQVEDPILRLDALGRNSFPSDMSIAAQASLKSPVLVRPSCNVLPGNQPMAIVLHYTRGPLSGALATFQNPHSTSAHYIIDRDGQILQLVPETMAAFHASCGGARGNCELTCPICDGPNGGLAEPYMRSIGIELVNQGPVNPDQFNGPIYEDFQRAFGYRYWEDYPEAQIAALRVLVEDIQARWGVPIEMVLGHSRINQKPDPGPALNLFWARYGEPAREPIFPPASNGVSAVHEDHRSASGRRNPLGSMSQSPARAWAWQ